MQISTACKSVGDDYSKDTFYNHNKNRAPCANCSSSQQACHTQSPYSPTLCRKCARENRDTCPPHMHRVDALIWKKKDRALRRPFVAFVEAADTHAPLSMEEHSHTKGSVVSTATVHLPAIIFPMGYPASVTNSQSNGANIYVPSSPRQALSIRGDLRSMAEEYVRSIDNELVPEDRSPDKQVFDIKDTGNLDLNRMDTLLNEWNELKDKLGGF
ncbi:hypothetical protein BD410DRAFT_867804 [Rickenella mellea]|uniref:Uncharacterized protein n=1 Tax=Rickenella mellea TaxID=50990 RepID=A0A4Y7Q3F5_9AGAM|nr:hypothetical protein BD410DRAFT_867804 [Rickenella mellea]